MSIENAPPKWNEIAVAAKACGVSDWALRKWLERTRIPGDWQLKIIEKTRGRIKAADMVIVDARKAKQEAVQ